MANRKDSHSSSKMFPAEGQSFKLAHLGHLERFMGQENWGLKSGCDGNTWHDQMQSRTPNRRRRHGQSNRQHNIETTVADQLLKEES
jgi:hypothetical protein